MGKWGNDQSWDDLLLGVDAGESLYSTKAIKDLLTYRIKCLEEKYSANAFEVKDEKENRSLKMYLQIKDHPIVKKYVLNQAVKDVAATHPHINGLRLIEAKYEMEREMGIKK